MIETKLKFTLKRLLVALIAFVVLFVIGAATIEYVDGLEVNQERYNSIVDELELYVDPEPIDYSQSERWMLADTSESKAVDVFYLYPTSWDPEPGSGQRMSSIDVMNDNNPLIRDNKIGQGALWAGAGNVFSPYYRQSSLDAMLEAEKLGDQYVSFLYKETPYVDIVDAFEYYLENFNHGRPFILAGHSQGSILLNALLQWWMPQHQDVASRMVAAYLIGAPVTREELERHPEMHFAQGALDTGVIVSFNTESDDYHGFELAIPGESLAINPISWTRSEEPAPASQSLGSRYCDFAKEVCQDLPHHASAQVDLEGGRLIAGEIDKEDWSTAEIFNGLFALGSYHARETLLYYYDLQQNAIDRTNAWLAEH